MALWLAETGSPAQIPLSILMVFASAKLFSEIFERMGQPGIVGEILAGVIIGPHVLGWMSLTQTLRILSDLGVMFLLFRVGLEVKASEFMRVGGRAVLVAIGGVAVAFLLGWGLTTAWGKPRIETIFTGAAMVATSVGITARVLASRGLLHTRASQVILAAAVADDVLGLVVLAVVSGVAKGPLNYLDIALTALIAGGFTVFIARFASGTVQRVIPRVRARLSIAEGEFALALCLMFALSLLAVYAGVAAIVGAFLAGMALSETVDRRVIDLTNGVAEFLVPFFLAGIGLQLDVSVFTAPATLAFAGTIVAGAICGKFIGCGLGALGLGRTDALRVGVGMIPQGEVGMVVAQIGLRMGAMPQSAYGSIVFMSVATTLIAPPLLKIVFRGEPREGPQEEETVKVG